MVTTAMGSPVVTEALTDAPDLVAGRTGERAPVVFSCCARREPGALTLTRRSDPHPLRWTWSWWELRTDARGWSGIEELPGHGRRACEVSPGGLLRTL